MHFVPAHNPWAEWFQGEPDPAWVHRSPWPWPPSPCADIYRRATGVLGSPDTYLGGQGNSSQHLTFHSRVQVWHQTLPFQMLRNADQHLNRSLRRRRSHECVDSLSGLGSGAWGLASFSRLLRPGEGFPSRQAAACKESWLRNIPITADAQHYTSFRHTAQPFGTCLT